MPGHGDGSDGCTKYHGHTTFDRRLIFGCCFLRFAFSWAGCLVSLVDHQLLNSTRVNAHPSTSENDWSVSQNKQGALSFGECLRAWQSLQI